MAARFPVPIQDDVRDLLVDLLGRGASVDKIKGNPLLDPALIAEFVTDEDEVGALCTVDAEFALRCGAALAMVPTTVVEEAIRKGELPAELVENVQEIANIMAQLLNGPRTPHLRLKALHQPPGDVPGKVTAVLDAPEFRRDFAIDIEGYGIGRLSLLAS